MSDATTPLHPAFDCIVALGSNLGDKAANIDRAIALLTERGDVRLLARSRNYATEPWGKTDQDWFVNAAIAVATQLDPRELLVRCKKIERAMGRVETEKWGPRIIDLDLLGLSRQGGQRTRPRPSASAHRRPGVRAGAADGHRIRSRDRRA